MIESKHQKIATWNWSILSPLWPQSPPGFCFVVAAALAILMLLMFGIIIRQVASESQSGADVIADAQSRLMPPAALSFILEAGRLGAHVDGETFGWTDVRPQSYTGAVSAAGVLTDFNHNSLIGPLLRTETAVTVDPLNGNLPGQVRLGHVPVRNTELIVTWERPAMAVKSVAAPPHAISRRMDARV